MTAANNNIRVVSLDLDDLVGILDSVDALATIISRLPNAAGVDAGCFVLGFSQELRAKHDLPDGPEFVL